MSDLLSRLESLKATERKTEAIAAYDAACESPDSADWQTIAHALRRVLPNPRKVPVIADLGANGLEFEPWYESRKRPKRSNGKDFDENSPRAEVTFADGLVIRAYAMIYKGGAPNIAGAVRSACDRWRYQTQPEGYEWRANVPEIVAVSIPECEITYDPAIVNEKTAEHRAPEAKPDLIPSLDQLRRASDARLKWLMESDCAVLSGLIHKNMQEILEYVWPPIPESMPDEPAPMPEAMPAPRKPVSALARKLMASALASPSVEAMPHPCIMVKPARVAFAIAA
jgi:hypothetical protein